MVGVAGVTPMETSVVEVTFRVVEPDRAPELAVMVVEPALTAVAIPLLPAVLLIDATFVADELHVTDAVIFCCEPSLKLPVAMNCRVNPTWRVLLAGCTAIDVSVGGVGPTIDMDLLENPQPAMNPAKQSSNAACIALRPCARLQNCDAACTIVGSIAHNSRCGL
jgi:hypothetical protein